MAPEGLLEGLLPIAGGEIEGLGDGGEQNPGQVEMPASEHRPHGEEERSGLKPRMRKRLEMPATRSMRGSSGRRSRYRGDDDVDWPGRRCQVEPPSLRA